MLVSNARIEASGRAGSQACRWSTSLILLSLLATGCGQKKSGPVAQELRNLGWLGSMYGQYISQNGGKAPKNVEELQKFVEKQTKPDELGRLKVASVKELFVSPRDGKPFKMVSYAKMPPPAPDKPPPVVFYEEVGKDGEKAVAYLGGGTQFVPESTLQMMLPAGSKIGS
jgi:hypothetical protein